MLRNFVVAARGAKYSGASSPKPLRQMSLIDLSDGP